MASADIHDEVALEASRRYIYETRLSEHKDSPIHSHSPSQHAHRARPLPDFRFESSYLRSIAPYVHAERAVSAVVAHDEKGKGRAVEGMTGEGAVAVAEIVMSSASTEVVRIDWGRVAWVTARDQILVPLIQGALWGLLSDYLRPLGAVAGARFRRWWAAGAGRPDGPQVEGHGVGWLRNWISSLTASSFARAPGVGVAKSDLIH
ncbi:hypothetical protein OBBRIDRAFT_797491 [Obba rivulosa]|uniref:Uncharacterized protein n=1 Tax=Obba rivulosa TaxID=1052685 RepID=A0A8E2ASZ8_9APHY|nr:hypothetical protein OBBRIDRAFT_797491 [Obba rivulosa]